MNPRTLLAIAISMLVLMSWPSVVKKFFPEVYQNASQKPSEQILEESVGQSAASSAVDPFAETQSLDNLPQIAQGAREIQEQIVRLSNDQLELELSNIGAVIKGIELKGYQNPDQSNVQLLAARSQQKMMQISDPQRFSSQGFVVTPLSQNSVRMAMMVPDILRVEKIFTLTENYGIEVDIYIHNLGNQSIEFKDGYELFVSEGLESWTSESKRFFVSNALRDMDGSKVQKFKKIEEREVIYPPVRWLAQQNKYFCIIAEPAQKIAAAYISPSTVFPKLTMRTEPLLVSPGASTQHRYKIYAGPKDIAVLNNHESGYSQVVSYGFFDTFSKSMLWLLKWLYGWVGSYGIAIILLTLLVKIVLMPLSQKQMKSMKGMQKINPHLKSLREQYKHDPARLNKEMMMLYKKHNVNPLGGCLPLLLQLPIFFALYGALLSAIELRATPFLWIADLSQKDPFYILPIVMGATMVLQQKMTPTAMDPAQAKMMMFLPVVMTIVFVNFPAGLVLYWLINNVLTIAHQAYMNAQHD